MTSTEEILKMPAALLLKAEDIMTIPFMVSLMPISKGNLTAL